MSMQWREGVGGGGRGSGDGSRSFSGCSGHCNQSSSLRRSTGNIFPMSLTRDVTNSRHATGANARFEWLRPWRTPQDCREGGLALLHTMQEIVESAQRARHTSVNERCAQDATGSPAESTTVSDQGSQLSPLSPRAGRHTGNDHAKSLDKSLRPSMHRESSQTPEPMLVHDGADASAVLASEAIVLDKMPHSLSGDSLCTSQMGLDDMADRTTIPSVNAGATVLSATARGCAESAATSTLDVSRERLLSQQQQQQQQQQQHHGRSSHQSSASRVRENYIESPSAGDDGAPSMAPAMDVEEGAAAAAAVATAATEATPRAVVPLATPLASSSPATAPPPPLVVPTIPNFSEIIARQEIVRQRQHEQLQQHPHPRSEAAQRKRCALASDDDDDKDDGARSPHSTFQISPGGEYDQTARPGGSRHHPVMSDDGRDSDSEVNTYQTSP